MTNIWEIKVRIKSTLPIYLILKKLTEQFLHIEVVEIEEIA